MGKEEKEETKTKEEKDKIEKEIEELRKRYEYFKFKVKEPILDIGGGQGFFLLSQGIKKAIIMDLTKNKNPLFNYIEVDLTKKLPSIKKKFNTIFITEALEHLGNPLYLLAQVYDLLSEEGICFISIPYTEIGSEHHHISRWTKKEILGQTKKLGFEPKIIQSRRRFMGFGFWLPHCWLVLSLKKKEINPNKANIQGYNLQLK